MALTKAHFRMIEGTVANVLDFGADNTGATDAASAIQAAIDSGASAVFLPAGIYKVSNVTISRSVHIYGEGNKNIYQRISSGITFSEIQQLPGTWIYSANTTDIPLELTCTSVIGGVKIEKLCFYQDHANYASPTNYKPFISDENSTSYFSGIWYNDLMFINAWQGIWSQNAERIDITDVNGDFFWKGIYIFNASDVCRIERLHVWSFSRSADAAAFRQSTSSSWALHLYDMDEIFVNDIFVWDRLYGVLLQDYWGSLDGYTADAVGNPLRVSAPRGFGVALNNIKINACNPDAVTPYAIGIVDTVGPATSVMLSNVSIWKGSNHTHAYEDGIYVDSDDLRIQMNNIILKYFTVTGININGGADVTVDNVAFMGAIGGQTGTDKTSAVCGLRVTDADARVKFSNVFTGPMKYVYDGYFHTTEFDYAPSVHETLLVPSISSVGSVTTASDAEFISKISVTGDGTANYTGVRTLSYPMRNQQFINGRRYYAGLVYGNTSAVTHTTSGDHLTFTNPSPSGQNIYIAMSPDADTNIKLSIVAFDATATSVPATGAYPRNFTGTFDFYSSFSCEGEFLVTPAKMPSVTVPVASAAPTATYGYWPAGHVYYDDTPSASGKIGFVCVTAGSPGTWKPFGAIDA